MRLWDAVADLLAAVVSYVRVDDDVFDQLLDLLADALARDGDRHRAALEAVNADAVWLAMYGRGRADYMVAPVLDGVEFVQMERTQ